MFIIAHATPQRRRLSDSAKARFCSAIFFRYFFFLSLGQLEETLNVGGGMEDFALTILRQSMVSLSVGSRLSKERNNTLIFSESDLSRERFLESGEFGLKTPP